MTKNYKINTYIHSEKYYINLESAFTIILYTFYTFLQMTRCQLSFCFSIWHLVFMFSVGWLHILKRFFTTKIQLLNCKLYK